MVAVTGLQGLADGWIRLKCSRAALTPASAIGSADFVRTSFVIPFWTRTELITPTLTIPAVATSISVAIGTAKPSWPRILLSIRDRVTRL